MAEASATRSAATPRAPAHGWIPKAAKIVLPIVAMVLVALMIFWARANLQFIRLQISETEVAPEDIDTVSMENAKFSGSDNRNRRFLVTAEVATQAIGDENTIDLQRIEANIVLANGAKVVIDADKGVYERDSKQLRLMGAVRLNHDRGYILNTTSASIDLKEKTASGDAPVSGTGPDGEINAEGFRVADDGNLIELIGRSRVLFNSADQGTIQ